MQNVIPPPSASFRLFGLNLVDAEHRIERISRLADNADGNRMFTDGRLALFQRDFNELMKHALFSRDV